MHNGQSGEEGVFGVVRGLPKGVVHWQCAKVTAEFAKSSFQQLKMFRLVNGDFDKVRVKGAWQTSEIRSGKVGEPG